MKRLALVTVLAIAAGVAVGVIAYGRAARSKAEPSAPAGSEASSDSPGVAAGLDDEVRRLRAEVNAKDQMIRELAKQALAPQGGAAGNSASVPAAPVRRSPAVRACELLDERLAAVPVDSRSAAEMQRALRDVLDPKVLGTTKIDSLQCGTTMCKVAMSGESAASMNGSVSAMMEHLPKSFGASAVYSTRDGETSVYVAKSGADLAVDLPLENPE